MKCAFFGGAIAFTYRGDLRIMFLSGSRNFILGTVEILYDLDERVNPIENDSSLNCPMFPGKIFLLK